MCTSQDAMPVIHQEKKWLSLSLAVRDWWFKVELEIKKGLITDVIWAEN